MGSIIFVVAKDAESHVLCKSHLTKTFVTDSTIHAINDCAFREACRNDHLDVAQWMWSLGGVNHYARDDYAFRGACWKGHRLSRA